MSFEKVLKNLMEENGLTQAALAKSIGYTQRAISKWINRQSEPSENAIIRIAHYFSVSTDFLLGMSDEFDSPTQPGTQLTDEERELLRFYRKLGKNRREDLFIYLRALTENEDHSAKKRANR